MDLGGGDPGGGEGHGQREQRLLFAQGDSIVGSLGVDNITAIPEPSTALLVAVGLGGLAAGGRRRR